MKTTFNILIMLLSALFLVPKAIHKTKVKEVSAEQIVYYFEPENISKKKMEIELLKGDLRILINEIELEKIQSKSVYRITEAKQIK